MIIGDTLMIRGFIGFVLIMWAIANGFTWLVGFDLDTKDKLIIPQAVTLFLIIVGIGGMLMGG